MGLWRPKSSIGCSEAGLCINGMFLYYACYFGIDPSVLESVVDFVLAQQLPDGRWPVQAAHPGQVHCVMEKGRSRARSLGVFHEQCELIRV